MNNSRITLVDMNKYRVTLVDMNNSKISLVDPIEIENVSSSSRAHWEWDTTNESIFKSTNILKYDKSWKYSYNKWNDIT